jgi:Shedu protein SduA, C-terminal
LSVSKKRHERPSEEEFLLSIRARQSTIPNCSVTQNCVLKNGPKTYKVASILPFKNPISGQVSHCELHLNDYPFRVGTGIQWEVKDRLKHWGCKDDEIEKLRAFLHTFKDANAPGDHSVIEGKPSPSLQELLKLLGELDSPNLSSVISALGERVAELQTLPPLGEQDNRRMVAAALRASHRMTALKELRRLIVEDADEEQFQEHLDRNWWMLGAQYVEKIPKRHWTDEETLDMMLRSADSGYDIIELKRSTAPLFKRNRKKWIVSADVNDAVNQAGHYISEIDRQRDHFIARYNTDLYRVKAKVLIGHISDDEKEEREKRLALRMYNSHLHNIEVVTFDGLVRICGEIVHANLGESRHSAAPESARPREQLIPF